MGSDERIVDIIRSSYSDHPGYQHRFWQWFSTGCFDDTLLRGFARIYYQHVRIFRLYIAGAITIAPSEHLQAVLAANLADEYGLASPNGGADGHPEMFRRFMRSLGLSESDWQHDRPIDGLQRFQAIHFALFRGGLVPETIGAVVFGMESTTPYRHAKVLEGIERFRRNTQSQRDIDATFFRTHVTGDESHSKQLLEAAMPFIESDPGGVQRGARLSYDAREIFLDDLAAELRADLSAV